MNTTEHTGRCCQSLVRNLVAICDAILRRGVTRADTRRGSSSGSTSPCIPRRITAPPGTCLGKAHPSCGGPPLRPLNALLAPDHRMTATTGRLRPARTVNAPPWRCSAKCCAAAITRCGSSAMPRSPNLTRAAKQPDTRGWRVFAHKSIDVRGRLPQRPCCHLLPGEHPAQNERPRPLSGTRTPGTPSVIMSPDSSVDPDKAGRRHAPTLGLLASKLLIERSGVDHMS